MDFTPTLTLPLLGILIGLILVGSHLFGLLASDVCMTEAQKFPRSRAWSTALLAITALWLIAFIQTTDLGEFSPMRNMVTLAVLAGSILFWKFVPDFLSSRSVGFLLCR